MTRILIAACMALTLAGCGFMAKSRLNPLNWFGAGKQREAIELVGDPAPDKRALAAEVTALEVVPYSAGAIVRATGRMPTQGWWEAELVARPLDENGTLVFDFRVFPPITDAPTGSAQSREVTVAATISPQRLDNVREIVVQGETNALSSRR